MNVPEGIAKKLSDLKKLLQEAVGHAESGSEEVKQALDDALDKLGEINSSADAIFDEALADLRRSPYTAPILISALLSLVLSGGLLGWWLKAWVGS